MQLESWDCEVVKFEMEGAIAYLYNRNRVKNMDPTRTSELSDGSHTTLLVSCYVFSILSTSI